MLNVESPPLAAMQRPLLTKFTGGRPGGRADRSGCSAGLYAPEHGLPPVTTVGARAGRFGRFLPVVIEGDQLPLSTRRAGCEGGVRKSVALAGPPQRLPLLETRMRAVLGAVRGPSSLKEHSHGAGHGGTPTEPVVQPCSTRHPDSHKSHSRVATTGQTLSGLYTQRTLCGPSGAWRGVGLSVNRRGHMQAA